MDSTGGCQALRKWTICLLFVKRKYQINLRIKLALKSMHVKNTINTNNEQMTEFTSLPLEGEKGKLLIPHNVTLNMISAASV